MSTTKVMVGTGMSGEADEARWATAPPSWLAIGRALLAAKDKSLIPAELARATKKDQSNVKKEAEAMVAADLLVAVVPVLGPSRTGRPPAKAYTLVAEHIDDLRAALEQRGTGGLRRGQELVYAAASAEYLDDLFTVLSQSADAAQAVWSGLCAGDSREYVLAFDGADPATPAVRLIGQLTAARVPCRQVTIVQLKPTHELLEEAQEVATEARRTRLSHDTRRAS